MKNLTPIIALCLFASCSGGTKTSGTQEYYPESAVEEIVEPVEVVEQEEAAPIDTAAIRKKTLAELASWGLKYPSFDEDGYICYREDPANIHTNPNDVAREMCTMFSSDPTMKGVKIISLLDGKTVLGSWTYR